ncbi:NAD(P)H-dependent flavin oxidoreductase [Novosphingobium taihuense]|uniref:NAD(P)H-dependent flavin oxidoreductase YrpB (Nitropropane dioxygenase family) n=1 Tax=Novosphingobium taihuense TaxID=260085 RepID=A0A7W7ABG0_9SPHN|nr:nitronate monooxygenase [Novosphingobium taihuense]MBB4613929.1 NAD(P)H-dependent flavin oxidoreductase YrpB (nitropropane dioxygenase family) [Novosphingobium taihuense]TWH86780.1 NAD(P)H-dependent flavin oxidoreductase YrpB (nitropropane dioxygenase family) [Novosphingobium taihuense]
MADPLATVLTERLGCRLPVIQTAMGWVAKPELVAASSNAGAFGFLAAAVMTPKEAAEEIARLRDLTPHMFGVNFHSFQPGAAEIVQLILANKDRVRAVSFGRGPDAKMIGAFRDAGILCIPTVGAVKHAEKMVQLGCEMVTVQGGEGGGHTGAVPTTVLLPQVLDAVGVPVVAAGGFGDGRGLAAALAYGAVGIAMGTRFLMTAESPVPQGPKAAYVKAGTADIAISTKVDGIPQRMILNPLLRRIEGSGKLAMWVRAMEAGLEMKRQNGMSWGQVIATARAMTAHGEMPLAQAIMAAAAPMMIMRAVVSGDAENGLMATGVVAGRLKDLPTCADLLNEIETEARGRIAALCNGN